jgi:hypothetical protein
MVPAMVALQAKLSYHTSHTRPWGRPARHIAHNSPHGMPQAHVDHVHNCGAGGKGSARPVKHRTADLLGKPFGTSKGRSGSAAPGQRPACQTGGHLAHLGVAGCCRPQHSVGLLCKLPVSFRHLPASPSSHGSFVFSSDLLHHVAHTFVTRPSQVLRDS